MPICEICGMEVVAVHECSECGAKFCDECGDVNRKLCYDCLGWEAGAEDESWDDENEDWEIWDDEWDEKEPN